MKNISPKYLSKISLLVSVLLILIIVVSCTPQITDEELEAELAKLTPEERAQLLEDLESKGGGALAGQAYGTFKTASVSPQRIMKSLSKISRIKCTDSDGGIKPLIYGVTVTTGGARGTDVCLSLLTVLDANEQERKIGMYDKSNDYCKLYSLSGVLSSSEYAVRLDDNLVSWPVTVISNDGCGVLEKSCGGQTGTSSDLKSTVITCSTGSCSNGACFGIVQN